MLHEKWNLEVYDTLLNGFSQLRVTVNPLNTAICWLWWSVYVVLYLVYAMSWICSVMFCYDTWRRVSWGQCWATFEEYLMSHMSVYTTMHVLFAPEREGSMLHSTCVSFSIISMLQDVWVVAQTRKYLTLLSTITDFPCFSNVLLTTRST